MGIYSKHIFPWILDRSLGTAELGEYRRLALAAARGETLEIGFGTGLNLPYYPAAVSQLTAVDRENMRPRRVESRIAAANLPLTRLQIDASQRLPFDDRSFDTVVTTMTLCSIAALGPALAEIARVLKTDGRYLFLEHGRSDDRFTARLQDLFNPLQRLIAGGCNLNRPIDQLLKAAGFEIMSLDRFLMPQLPRIMAEIYRGIAVFPHQK